MINYNFVLEKAAKEKIDRITILREYWQFLFLQKLYEQKQSADIYFKGGTAIRFLFGSFRFSEDLDFNSSLGQKTLVSTIEAVFEELKKGVAEEITLRKERAILDSIRFRLVFFHRFTTQANSIRIDISTREKSLTREETVLTPFDYPISPYPLVIHLGSEEILAEKLRALLIRGKARDIFDVWFLLTKNIPVNNKMIVKKMKIYPKKKFDFQKIIKKIKDFAEEELKQDLSQFLPENYRQFYEKLPKLTIELIEKTI